MIARFETALWQSPSTWWFITLPEELSEQIRSVPRPPAPGFGSLRVSVTVGGTVWATSIFPDSTSGCYLLPVKKTVRAAEKLGEGGTVQVELEVLD